VEYSSNNSSQVDLLSSPLSDRFEFWIWHACKAVELDWLTQAHMSTLYTHTHTHTHTYRSQFPFSHQQRKQKFLNHSPMSST